MALDSMKEIFERSARENIPFWEIVLQYDMEERQVSRQASMAKMLSTWQAIQDAADSYTGTQRSVSGLVGGDGLKMRLYARRGESIGGEFMDEVIVQASPWRSRTPACAALWQHRRRARAVWCRRCCCRCASASITRNMSCLRRCMSPRASAR